MQSPRDRDILDLLEQYLAGHRASSVSAGGREEQQERDEARRGAETKSPSLRFYKDFGFYSE